MRISIEIKEGKFIYSYAIGSSKHTSLLEITPEALLTFANILQLCNKAAINENEDFWNDLKAKAYIEKNKEEMKKYFNSMQ